MTEKTSVHLGGKLNDQSGYSGDNWRLADRCPSLRRQAGTDCAWLITRHWELAAPLIVLSTLHVTASAEVMQGPNKSPVQAGIMMMMVTINDGDGGDDDGDVHFSSA